MNLPSLSHMVGKISIAFINSYLIFSLNFLGIFAHGPPNSQIHQDKNTDNRTQDPDSFPETNRLSQTSFRVPFPEPTWTFSDSNKDLQAKSSFEKLTPRRRRATSDKEFRPSPLASSLLDPSTTNISIKGSPVVTIQLEPLHVQTSRPLATTPNVIKSDQPVGSPDTQVKTLHTLASASVAAQTTTTQNLIDLSKVEHFSVRPIEQVVDPPPLNVRFPSHVTHEQLVENSIDRFDAYGTYDYTQDEPEEVYPQRRVYGSGSRLQRPLARPHQRIAQNPPQRIVQKPTSFISSWFNRPPSKFQFPYGGPPRRQDNNSPFLKLANPGQLYQTSPNSIPLDLIKPVTSKPGLVNSLLGFMGLGSSQEKFQPQGPDFSPSSTKVNYNNANAGPSVTNGGVADQILNLFGLKDKTTTALKGHDDYSLPQNGPYLNNHLDFDYYEDDSGYGGNQNNYLQSNTQQKPLSVSSRIVKWFDGFKIPQIKKGKKSNSPSDRVHQSLDYTSYDTGDDHNLVFYDKPVPADDPFFGFGDVLDGIRKNETTVEIAKKFLSAAAALSARSDNGPTYLLWTLPTTLFAILGLVYFFGALAILGYKASTSGGGVQIIPVVVVFAIPIAVAIGLVTARAAINGELNMNHLARGDFKNSMRSDFDGVDFTMDALFGATSILGAAWIASVVL